ncbi:hypothetical protein CD351_10205 [Erythrobacter sp. KY5]|uniref:hypothetical protein n=1 Tax=Erythrobacter sp. KY5 TaxID=2011159 RepID=UPI000DBF26AD|nr:hypothetical protein [Erythrobacter sp. KY5]AWW74795.1 hypothetical protein CD351_10205 [Erythrobacter sp. KY5]
MKNIKTSAKLAVATGMAFATISAAPAAAQPSDLDPAAVAAASRYALPIAFDSFVTKCSTSLDRRGYALSNSERLMAKFSDGIDEAWPAAKDAMILMASGNADTREMTAVFAMLGDDELRPFVDGLVGGLIGQEIKTDDCEVIERGLEILDPLPAENIAQMVGLIVELGARDEEEEVASEGTAE